MNPTPALARTDLLIMGVLTVVAVLLRLPGLDYGLWFDEIWTLLDFIRLPVTAIVTSVDKLNNHVLYSLSAHLTSALFGESTWSIRLPSMVFGVLTVPAMYYLGLQLSSRQESLLATAFLVFSYHHVWFSQNARGYSGVALGMVVASILFIRLITTPEPRARLIAGYAFVVALTAWMNLAGALMVIIHGVTLLGLVPVSVNKGRIKDLIAPTSALALSIILMILLYSPIFGQVLGNFSVASAVAPAQYEWNSGMWTLGEFINGFNHAIPGGWIAVVAVAVVFVAGVAGILQRGLLIGYLVLFPVLVSVAVALLAQDIFFPRFVVSALPFILFIGVTGGFKLASIMTPFLSQTQVLLVGLVVVLLAGSQVPRAWGPKQDFAKAASFIEDNRQADTAFLCLGLTYKPMVDYLGTDCLQVDSLDALEQIESTREIIYLFYTLPINLKFLFPGIVKHMEDHYTLARIFTGTLGGGDIMVMTRDNRTAHSGSQP